MSITQKLQAPAVPPSPAAPSTGPVQTAPQTPTPDPSAPQPHQFSAPQNAQGAAWLEKIGSQLSDQLISARGRRNELARLYERATGVNREGLAEQLRILDHRIAQLEVDIGEVGRLKTQMPATPTTTPPAFNFNPEFARSTGGVLPILLAFFVLLPVSLGVARWFWRRSMRPVTPPGWADASARLERVEQALDTIAIEIERVSEGQRYVSRIVTEQASAAERSAAAGAPGVNSAQPLPALGAGSPEPIILQQQREEMRVRRS
jgi:hypothetical protein